MYSFILIIDIYYLILIFKNLNFNSFFLYLFKCYNASKQYLANITGKRNNS